MKPPTCVYHRDRDNFELTMPGYRKDLSVEHILTAEEANALLYELQHAVWARQGAGAAEVGS
jgi:hypothetical protein